MAQKLNRQSGKWTPLDWDGLQENWNLLEDKFNEHDTRIYQAIKKARSAYELWLEQGNKGNLQDFFNAIKGDTVPAEEVAELLEPDIKTKILEELSKLSAPEQSQVEIIAARDGEADLFSKLKIIEEKASTSLEQVDFVNKLVDLLHYDEVQVKKSSDRTLSIVNFNKSTQRHVTNILSKNANDDYFILSESYIGGVSFSELDKEQKNYEKVSGTIDTTYPTHWASKGAKIKVLISGSEIYFRRYGDNRGGIWRFILDGDNENFIDVSTWKDSAASDYYSTDDFKIFSGLEDKEHLIEAEFIGDDPLHVPSTGAGTSRGFLSQSTMPNSMTFKSYFNNLNTTREKSLNQALSNKDFAYLAREAGTDHEFHFIPEHNATGTAFKNQDMILKLDGKVLNFNEMKAGIGVIGKNFTMIQNVNGIHPISKKALLNIQTILDINIKSEIRMVGKTKALVDVEIKDGYHGMLPVTNEVGRRLVSGLYNEYPATKNDGTRTNLSVEKDTTNSYIFVSDINKKLFSALRINAAFKTLRSGLDGKFPITERTWIEHRLNASMQKLYNSIYRYGILKTGESITFDLTYLSGEIENVDGII